MEFGNYDITQDGYDEAPVERLGFAPGIDLSGIDLPGIDTKVSLGQNVFLAIGMVCMGAIIVACIAVMKPGRIFKGR